MDVIPPGIVVIVVSRDRVVADTIFRPRLDDFASVCLPFPLSVHLSVSLSSSMCEHMSASVCPYVCLGLYVIISVTEHHSYDISVVFCPTLMSFAATTYNKSSTVIWEEPRRHPSRQRMDSPAACASCAMPTADESNHSAADMLHLHRSATISLHVTLHCPILPLQNIAPSYWG